MTTPAANPQTLYWIPEYNVKPLFEKLEKINRKAEKLGSFAVQFRETGNSKVEEIVVGYETTLQSAPDQVAIKRKVMVREVEVIGAAPKLNGWSFTATLEHANELGNVLRVVPGYAGQLPEKFRNASPENCDHCHTRRQRNDTYVLNHEDGRWAQVGSTCLKDFLGYNDPHGAARFCEMLLQVGEACVSAGQGGYGGSGEYLDDLREFLAFCAAQIRHGGFISRKAEREAAERGQYGVRSTASATLHALHPSHDPKTGRILREEWEVPTPDDYLYAEKVTDWCMMLKARDPSTLNDFMHNVKVATGTGYVGGKKAGIAAAAIPAYRREMEPKDDFSKSRHIGAVGEKVEGNAKLLKIFMFEGNYGVAYLHKFLTEGGNVAVWFANKSSGMLEGQSYLIRGTVKKHDQRNGVAQTVLGRVKVVTPKAPKARKAAKS